MRCRYAPVKPGLAENMVATNEQVGNDIVAKTPFRRNAGKAATRGEHVFISVTLIIELGEQALNVDEGSLANLIIHTPSSSVARAVKLVRTDGSARVSRSESRSP